MRFSSSNLLRYILNYFIIKLGTENMPRCKVVCKVVLIVDTFVLKGSGHPQVRFTFKL